MKINISNGLERIIKISDNTGEYLSFFISETNLQDEVDIDFETNSFQFSAVKIISNFQYKHLLKKMRDEYPEAFKKNSLEEINQVISEFSDNLSLLEENYNDATKKVKKDISSSTFNKNFVPLPFPVLPFRQQYLPVLP